MASTNQRLRAGDFVFLAFLAVVPQSPYDIKKAMSASVSNFWSAAHSQVYQQANRLLRDGYVSARRPAGPRRRQTLELTDKGREALDEWLQRPAADYEIHDETLVKVYFGQLTDRTNVARVLSDQLVRHRRLLDEYETISAILRQQDTLDQPPYHLLTADLGVRIERAWVSWIRDALRTINPGLTE